MHDLFLNIIKSSDLEQRNMQPTHKVGNTLDLLLSNLPTSDPDTETSCSDHHIVLYDVFTDSPVSRSMVNNNTLPYYNFNKAKLPDLMTDCYDLKDNIDSAIIAQAPIDEMWVNVG